VSSASALSGVVDRAAAELAAAGVASPRLDARLLVAHVLGLDQTALITGHERTVSASERRRIARAVARRARREPVSRILGTREFWSLPFRLSPATLDPRPDSETLIEAVLRQLPDRMRDYEILDLGTGTGCLLLALLSELPQARGFGIDISRAALSTARANARALGLGARARFAPGDWAQGLRRHFDLVVTNPPYIATGEMAELAPELGFEPRQALVAGPDGLDAYRAIAPALPGLLRPAGFAALEIGCGQALAVAEVLGQAGLEAAAPLKDLAGLDRVLVARVRN
jgi:release factor glutamine methyltransferase